VTSFIEKDLMDIAIQWNKLEFTPKVDSDRLRNAGTVHTGVMGRWMATWTEQFRLISG